MNLNYIIKGMAMMDIPRSKTKRCENPGCGRSFITGKNAQRYCSEECRASLYKKKGGTRRGRPRGNKKRTDVKSKKEINKRVIILKSHERLCINPSCRKIFTAEKFMQKFCDECMEKGMKDWDVQMIVNPSRNRESMKRKENDD